MPFFQGADVIMLGEQTFLDKSTVINHSPATFNGPAQIVTDHATGNINLPPSAATSPSASAADPSQTMSPAAILATAQAAIRAAAQTAAQAGVHLPNLPTFPTSATAQTPNTPAPNGSPARPTRPPVNPLNPPVNLPIPPAHPPNPPPNSHNPPVHLPNPPPNPHNPPDIPTPSSVSVGLSLGEQALNLARPIGIVSQAPGLREAAEIALVILDGVKKARKNKADFERIGKQCITLVEIIKMRVDPQTPGAQLPGAQLGADAHALIDTLIAIKKYIVKFNSRSWTKRFFLAWVDIDIVQECRGQLAFAVTQFQLASLISLRQDMQYMQDILNVSQSEAAIKRARRQRYKASEIRMQEIAAAQTVITLLEATAAQEVAEAREMATALMAAALMAAAQPPQNGTP